jgi:nucleoside diphosphate kinase
LNVEEEEKGLSLPGCVLVIKPNQPINVAIRTLKQIINKENWDRSDEPLSIQKLQVVQYTEKQIELLYEHEFQYDQNLSNQAKARSKAMFQDFFKADQKSVAVVQALIVGRNAISKVKRIVGDKDPKNAVKNTMRSFYANDRFDNAFFCSENFSESLIEREVLFQDEAPTGHTGIKVSHKVKSQAGVELSPID